MAESKVQRFALRDATVLSTFARDGFCESKYCGGYDCPLSHDEALRKKFREIALRLAQRGYGPPKKRALTQDQEAESA